MTAPNPAPTAAALRELLGPELAPLWDGLRGRIEARYEMDVLWGGPTKAWTCECRYRRGGKTLCGLYAREGELGFLVIFGAREREAFAAQRAQWSPAVQAAYDQATTYHDGKWVMFAPRREEELDELVALLSIKRRPNRR